MRYKSNNRVGNCAFSFFFAVSFVSWIFAVVDNVRCHRRVGLWKLEMESEREMSRVMINNFVIIKTLPWIVLLALSIFTVRALCEVDVFALADTVHAWVVLQLVIHSGFHASIAVFFRSFIFVALRFERPIYIQLGSTSISIQFFYSIYFCVVSGLVFSPAERILWCLHQPIFFSDKSRDTPALRSLCGVFHRCVASVGVKFVFKSFLILVFYSLLLAEKNKAHVNLCLNFPYTGFEHAKAQFNNASRKSAGQVPRCLHVFLLVHVLAIKCKCDASPNLYKRLQFSFMIKFIK